MLSNSPTISNDVFLTISETDRRLLGECVLYLMNYGSFPSMFKYLWARFNTEQKLLVEFILHKNGFNIDSQGILVL